MNLTRPILVLFGLNFVDAILTIIWIETGVATEANQLMGVLLSLGILPFLLFKIAMGTFTAGVLLYGSSFRLARIGVAAGLATYAFAMCAHLFTGLAAFGMLA
ncbi:MAG: DUF5658 family protein [Pyrinomonadaceae bacterium]